MSGLQRDLIVRGDTRARICTPTPAACHSHVCCLRPHTTHMSTVCAHTPLTCLLLAHTHTTHMSTACTHTPLTCLLFAHTPLTCLLFAPTHHSHVCCLHTHTTHMSAVCTHTPLTCLLFAHTHTTHMSTACTRYLPPLANRFWTKCWTLDTLRLQTHSSCMRCVYRGMTCAAIRRVCAVV
jgi:hypothetical protein